MSAMFNVFGFFLHLQSPGKKTQRPKSLQLVDSRLTPFHSPSPLQEYQTGGCTEKQGRVTVDLSTSGDILSLSVAGSQRFVTFQEVSPDGYKDIRSDTACCWRAERASWTHPLLQGTRSSLAGHCHGGSEARMMEAACWCGVCATRV